MVVVVVVVVVGSKEPVYGSISKTDINKFNVFSWIFSTKKKL